MSSNLTVTIPDFLVAFPSDKCYRNHDEWDSLSKARFYIEQEKMAQRIEKYKYKRTRGQCLKCGNRTNKGNTICSKCSPRLRPLITCVACQQEAQHRALGLCGICYAKSRKPPKKPRKITNQRTIQVKRLIVCSRCKKIKPTSAYGMCYTCYHQNCHHTAPVEKCSICNKDKPRFAKNMCQSCYAYVYYRRLKIDCSQCGEQKYYYGKSLCAKCYSQTYKRKQLVICISCEKLRPHEARGQCGTCYGAYRRKNGPKRVCERCKKKKTYAAKGLCYNCYGVMRHEQKKKKQEFDSPSDYSS